ncbi:F-box protein [Quillaja saponaria]|nr:F-box protein [Quillaja saponaria]
MLPGKETMQPVDSTIFLMAKLAKSKSPNYMLSGAWEHPLVGYLLWISGEISLLNPTKKAQIQLPMLSTLTNPTDHRTEEWQSNVYSYIDRATISKNPSKSNDFVVVAIFTDYRVLAFCKPGDKEWPTLTTQGDHCEDVIYHKGEECLRRYLVETPEGELLKVCRYMEWDDYYDDEEEDYSHGHALRFGVYMLTENSRRWTKVRSLGSKALLLGYNRGICLSASKHLGFKANCIYSTDDFFEGYNGKPDGCHDMGAYNLEDESIKRNLKKAPKMSTPCIWVESHQNERSVGLILERNNI